MVLAGDHDDARALLAGVDPELLASGSSDQEIVSAVWAASRVGWSPELQLAAGARLGSIAGDVVADSGVVLGPLALSRALSVATAGPVDAALDHVRSAIEVADARAPYWGASVRLEAARLLAGALDVLGPADEGRDALERERRTALESASLFFRSAGHRHMTRRCDELRSGATLAAVAAPGLGHLVRVSTDGGDERWQVGLGVQPPVVVAGSRGMDALAYLLRNRHRSVPAIELAAHVDGSDVWVQVLDEVGDDPELMSERIHDDRARSRVSKLLRRVVDGLHDRHGSLGLHLDQRLRTGYVCGYDDDATRWRL